MNSLRRRLGRVLLVLLGGMVIQWFLADRTIVYAGEREMQTRLQHDADSLFSTLAVAEDGRLQFNPRSAGTIYTRVYSGHYFVMQVDGQRIQSPSFGDTPAFDPRAIESKSLDHVAGPQGQPLLVLTTHIDAGGKRVVLAVGEDLTELRGELLRFRLLFLALSLAVLAGAVALQGRELRWALRPLDEIRDAVPQLYSGGRPLVAAEVPIEVRPLVDEIIRLMGFVEQRLQQSRTAIGNLSHALKTPLTAIFRLLEDPRMNAQPDLRQLLQQQAEAIHQRIDRELKRARLAGDEPTRSAFEAWTELPAVAQLLQRIHRDKPLAIEWNAPQHALAIDREDLLELIGTLADNACKWADHRVTITILEGDGIDIVVADDGPGCSPESLASLGTRGEREDESMPGYGLGLAIARDIVEFAGGSLRFARSAALGGFEVTAHFPPARRDAGTSPVWT